MNNMNNQSQLGTLNGIFPCPVYIVKRDVGLSPKEDKDIEDIIKEGLNKSVANVCSVNTYIFNNKLKEIKQIYKNKWGYDDVMIQKDPNDPYMVLVYVKPNKRFGIF